MNYLPMLTYNQPYEEMKIHSISGLIKKNVFPDILTILTPYLQTVGLPLTLHIPVVVGEPAGNVFHPEPNVNEVVEPIFEPLVSILQDHEVINSQLLSLIQEPKIAYEPDVAISPNPSSSLNSQPVNFEGESAQEAPYKESDPILADLPHPKRRKSEYNF